MGFDLDVWKISIIMVYDEKIWKVPKVMGLDLKVWKISTIMVFDQKIWKIPKVMVFNRNFQN